MKKWSILLLALILVMSLGACNTNKNDTSDPGSSSEASGEEQEIEISLDTHFYGTKKNEGGETTGVYVFLIWYPERVEYQISEHLSDFNNVVFFQEGTMDRPEDDILILDRDNMLSGGAPNAEEEAGVIKMWIVENDLNYEVTWGEVEDTFVLGIMSEDEIETLKKA